MLMVFFSSSTSPCREGLVIRAPVVVPSSASASSSVP
ncbi:hypothetical protein LINPERPRIM_LOCUS11342 [Linum perenne]